MPALQISSMNNPRNRLQHLWLSLCKRPARIGLLAAAAAALLASGCESLRGVVDVMHKPEVRVASAELEALSFSSLTLRFDVEIENPNPIGISLAGFDYELQIEGNSFVGGEVDERIAVEARKRSIVPLPVELAFEDIVDTFSQLEDQEEAASTLGANGWQTFWKITLPAIRSGVTYGVVLATARALGEFGAVSVVSNNVAGETETVPLFVARQYELLGDNVAGAYAASIVLAIMALITLLSMYLIRRRDKVAESPATIAVAPIVDKPTEENA